LNAGIIPVELGNFSRQYDLAWQQIKSA
jgi:hypothetical protein